MSKKLALILTAFSACAGISMMHAQALPSLGVAEEITKGSLPNGIEYCLVSNPVQKGFADFALVRDSGADPGRDREALSSLPHFGDRVPYEFLADNGIGYGPEGFLSHSGDAAVYALHDVPVYDRSVADSVLLMLVDIVSTSSRPQSVVVCGDIDAAQIRERLGLLSMMVPRLDARVLPEEPLWTPRDSMLFLVSRNSTYDVAAINAVFTAERLPREMLDTPQPLVARAYAYILGQIVTRRVEQTFAARGIPLASARYRYDDSSQGPGPERYSFSVYTSFEHIYEAIRIFAAVLSDLDARGAALPEFIDAKQKLINESKRTERGRVLSNAEYLDKCIASYLYGSTLASESAISGFLAARSMNPQRELVYFNSFVSALLDSSRNLTLRLDVPDLGLDRRAALETFRNEWEADSSGEVEFKQDYSDTLSLFEPLRRRVKLMGEIEEPVTGGRLWTFSNGIKVLYKKTAEKGEFRYCLMLRGGVAGVPGLGKGESAFVGDMLFLDRIASLTGSDFKAMLSANGITMDQEAGISDLRIGGIAPNSKLPLLMRSLLSVAQLREPDSSAFARYRLEEALRIDMSALSPRDVNSLMDSIMRPDYYFTQRKYMDNLGEDLPVRTREYFNTLFSKVNDGLLVFVGDLDEEELKRELCRTLGSFGTTRQFARRPRVRSKMASGSVTYTVESAPGLVGGGEIGVNVGMAAMLPYNMRNYMAFRLAVSCIRRELVDALAGSGAYIDMRDDLEVFPSERVSLFISCKPCRSDGLPAGVEPASPLELLPAVRRVTSNLTEINISAEDLKAYKEELKSSFAHALSEPRSEIEAALVRYSEGKDLVSGYEEAIDSVDAALVEQVLGTLASGAGVEYVII